MKKSFIIFFITIFIVSLKTNAQYNSACTCSPQTQGATAYLTVNGAHYMCMSPNATITIPAIEALFGTSNYTGNISGSAQAFCAGPPTTPGGPSPCLFGRAQDNFNIKNNSTPLTGIDYRGNMQGGGVSATVTLPVGVSIITVYGVCLPNSGPYIESKCQTGIFSVTVLPSPPPFSVSITNQCHTIIPTGQTIPVNSGNYKFKINFSLAPPQGTIVILLKNNIAVEQKLASPLNLNTDYYFENSTSGYGNGNYKVKLMYNNVEIFASNLPAGYTYNTPPRNLNCIVLRPSNPNFINATPKL